MTQIHHSAPVEPMKDIDRLPKLLFDPVLYHDPHLFVAAAAFSPSFR
jgi:hypothetical protein